VDNVTRAIEILETWLKDLEYYGEPLSDGFLGEFYTEDLETIRDAILLLKNHG